MKQANTTSEEELDEILESFGYSIVNNPQESRTSLKMSPKQALIAWRDAAVVEARKETYDLIYWKYKELNSQSVDIKFAEAYDVLTSMLTHKEKGQDSNE